MTTLLEIQKRISLLMAHEGAKILAEYNDSPTVHPRYLALARRIYAAMEFEREQMVSKKFNRQTKPPQRL